MSVRPYRSYSVTRIRGKTFVKRGFFHTKGAWRARNYYKRTFRRRTEQEEEEDDDPPQICDEVGADDDEEGEEVEKKDAEDEDKEVKKEDGDDDDEEEEAEEEKVKEEPSVAESVEPVINKEEKKSHQDDEKGKDQKEKAEDKPQETTVAVAKDDIEDMMLSGEWEVMDETDEEDDEPTRKRSRSDKSSSATLAIEVAVPEIAEKLKEITDPLVGLEYIVEIKNESDCTYYSCLLCKRPGRIAALLRHLNYIEHKMRYLERHLGDCASAFPRGNPTTFKHEYLVAMEKLCTILGESNERRQTLLITTKDFYMQKMRALALRAEQLPHMTFKDDATWKKVFEDLGLPTKPTSRRRRRSRSRSRDRRSRSNDRSRRSRSRDRYRDSYRDNYHDRGDSYSNGYRGRGRGRYGDYVPYQQYNNRYNNYYRNDWGSDRGGYDNRSPYYYYEDRSWNDYRNQGYYHRDEDTRYGEYEHRGRSSYRRYQERDSRSSYLHHESAVDSSHSVGSGSRTSGAIFATTIKKRPAAEKPPAKKEVLKKTSAADVKKLWDKLTKPEEHKKKEEDESKSFWDQWLDVHDEEDANSKGSNEVTVIDQVSSTAGASKGVNSDLNSVAELLDKNLTQIMNNYDPNKGPMFPAYTSSGTPPSEKVILATKIAKALTTIGMGKIPQETLVLILQQLGLLPGGHGHAQHSRAMDNLRKTIVKFDSVSRSYQR